MAVEDTAAKIYQIRRVRQDVTKRVTYLICVLKDFLELAWRRTVGTF